MADAPAHPNDLEKASLTELLQAWGHGDRGALNQLIPLIHQDLRRLARQRLRTLASGSTMQATGLVNELYLRLVDTGRVNLHDRAHFFAIAATLMRQIVIDHIRAKSREKRGGEWCRITLSDSGVASIGENDALRALDQAMGRLAVMDERKARVVEMRFFGGLTNAEIAEVTGVSVDTIKRDWTFAKLWLARELKSTLPT